MIACLQEINLNGVLAAGAAHESVALDFQGDGCLSYDELPLSSRDMFGSTRGVSSFVVRFKTGV